MATLWTLTQYVPLQLIHRRITRDRWADKNTIQLAPAEFLIGMGTNEIAGAHCLEHTNPGFRERAKQGFNIVVAGKGFGCGSSREQGVMALLGW